MKTKSKIIRTSGAMNKIIFFGNGPLADYALPILANSAEIIFHARSKDDLANVAELKKQNPDAFGVLASFGLIIKSDLLELFEPEGIINLHPSLLPQFRGASPIESAILAGATDFSYSIMKLAKAMDAGPIYHQATLSSLPLDKDSIYRTLAETGATWIAEHLDEIRTLSPTPQDDTAATFCGKLDKSLSYLQPDQYPATQILRQIVAYQSFPKPKYTFFGKVCIILKAHIGTSTESATAKLLIPCSDDNSVIIDQLQPEGKKPMDAKSFLNGYAK